METPSQPTENTRAEPSARADALGGAVARGMSFMVAVALFGKVLSTVATVVLGLLLTDHDYGLYGLALGVAGLLTNFRDGGLRQIAIQRGPAGFARLVGPVGWLSLTINASAGALLAIAAPLAAAIYAQPLLLPMLLVVAVALPLMTVGSIARADLEVHMRYGDLAIMTAWNNITRYGSMVVFASLGLGAFAFVLPNVLVAIVEAVLGVRMTRRTFLSRPARPGVWRTLMGRAKWTLTGTIGIAALDRGDYAVLGLFITSAAVGLYTFAYQIALQVNTVLSANFQRVLLPALARFADDPARHRAAVRRSLRSLSLLSAGGGLALACVFPSLERLIWGGKWSDAVLPVQLMCFALPMRMCIIIHNAAAQSLAFFKSWAVFNWIQAAGLLLTAAAAGIAVSGAGDDQTARVAATVTAVLAAFYALVIPVMIAIRLRVFGINARETLGHVYIPWLTALVPGLVVLWAQRWAMGTTPTPAGAGDHVVSLFASAAAFAVMHAVTVRLLLRRTTSDLVSLAPARIRPLLRTILLMRSPADAHRQP